MTPANATGRRRLLLIGIGAGDPDHVTVQAVAALNAFDVLLMVDKRGAAEELVALRLHIVERHRTAGPYDTFVLADPPRPWREAPDYRAAVERWREQRAIQWEAALADVPDGRTGAFLVWGDPSLYESTLAVVQEIADRGNVALDFEVIPGVSAVHALCARHRIPLNRVGRAVQITPARLLAAGMPADVDDVVVMLDAHTTFAAIDPAGLDIYWGAYLGMPDELLISGRLEDQAPVIAAARAQVRERKGWIFDTYLLRRR